MCAIIGVELLIFRRPVKSESKVALGFHAKDRTWESHLVDLSNLAWITSEVLLFKPISILGSREQFYGHRIVFIAVTSSSATVGSFS